MYMIQKDYNNCRVTTCSYTTLIAKKYIIMKIYRKILQLSNQTQSGRQTKYKSDTYFMEWITWESRDCLLLVVCRAQLLQPLRRVVAPRLLNLSVELCEQPVHGLMVASVVGGKALHQENKLLVGHLKLWAGGGGREGEGEGSRGRGGMSSQIKAQLSRGRGGMSSQIKAQLSRGRGGVRGQT